MGKRKKQYKHVASRVLNTELYLEPGYAVQAIQFLTGRMVDDFSIQHASSLKLDEKPAQRWLEANAENEVWQLRPDGTAVIRVEGSMYKGSSLSLNSSLGVGYSTIVGNIEAALSDPRTKRVALIWDSPGGEVNGCFAAAQKIRDLCDAAGIPFWSFVDEGMFSAAYGIGAKADRIILPKSAATGSVGVVSTHVSYEDIIKEQGLKITFITSGDKKVVGSAYEDLSEDDFNEIQTRVLKYANIFYESVAEDRPLSVAQIADAQANIFIGQDAVDGGFADEVMDIDDFFYAFEQEDNNTKVYTGTNEMNKKDLEELKAKADSVDDLEAKVKTLTEKVSALTEDKQNLEAELEQAKTAASEKHERYVSVMESEEAQTRRTKASELLADAKFDAFSAEDLTEHLGKMSHDELPGNGDDDDKDNRSTAELLAAARKNDSDTSDVTNRGELTEGKDKSSADKGKEKPTYQSELSDDPDENRKAMLAAAALVKQKRSRSHI